MILSELKIHELKEVIINYYTEKQRIKFKNTDLKGIDNDIKFKKLNWYIKLINDMYFFKKPLISINDIITLTDKELDSYLQPFKEVDSDLMNNSIITKLSVDRVLKDKTDIQLIYNYLDSDKDVSIIYNLLKMKQLNNE